MPKEFREIAQRKQEMGVAERSAIAMHSTAGPRASESGIIAHRAFVAIDDKEVT